MRNRMTQPNIKVQYWIHDSLVESRVLQSDQAARIGLDEGITPVKVRHMTYDVSESSLRYYLWLEIEPAAARQGNAMQWYMYYA
jgi:hypothetical protein